jgi:recombination DNA repair RAD52 pathway protein
MTDPNIPNDFNESLISAGSGRGLWEADGPQLGQLLKPLAKDRVSNRKQGGSTLSYVEAWDIKRMLIRIFGFANFSADLLDAKVLRIIEADEPVMQWENGKPVGPKVDKDGVPEMKHMFTVLAQCTYRLTIHASGATYTETAAASQKGPDIGEVTDFALKTAESDALKRSAIYLGTQFGLGLYDNGQLGDIVNAILEPWQKDILGKWRENQARAAQQQQTAIAAGQPVQQDAPTDDRPMAMYEQADPNAGDGLTPPPTRGGRGAVAGAFSHAVKNAAGPSVNSVAGAEHYAGESYGDNV